MQDHTVSGAPRAILRLEGLAALAAATAASSQTGQGWWIFAILRLVPDIFMLGYLSGSRTGAAVYNLGNIYLLPAAGWPRRSSLPSG